MAQRIYWVPHTVCFLGCEHCHNDSSLDGNPGTEATVEAVVRNLPDRDSRYRLEEILIGGGEPLARPELLALAVARLRARFPQGPADLSIDQRRAAGHLVIAIQTNGIPLANAYGRLRWDDVGRWLALGVDYFHVASGDSFHQSRLPDYPWTTLHGEMAEAASRGVLFNVYGKAPTRLVPSGRVLDNLDVLAGYGAELLREPDYCGNGWETASNWSRPEGEHPDSSEVVVDERGLVHPCCWYRISPALFDLTRQPFAAGMAAAARVPAFAMLDRGDILGVGALVGLTAERAATIRDEFGDCGACRLFFRRLADRESTGQSVSSDPAVAPAVRPLDERERAFYSRVEFPAL